jgi:NAD+ kinase
VACTAVIPDFCVVLGGDGTVLHTASLFCDEKAMPPMLAFAMGTLGFLTLFEAANFEPLLTRYSFLIAGWFFCSL